MAFLFPHDRHERLDSKERLRCVPTEKLLAALALKPGMRLIDVGSGSGTFFFPAFESVEGEGVFVAVELQEEMLKHFFARLENYKSHPNFSRIEVAHAKRDRLPLPDASADRLMLVHVWHEIEDRVAYAKELWRVLAPGGQLLMVDWRTAQEEPGLLDLDELMGPPLSERVAEKLALLELETAGFDKRVSHSGFPQNWCLTARR